MQAGQIGAIGVDFGSQRSVIAVAKKGGVEVLANEGSHRETQNIIGFGERERFIGEQGALQMRGNFKNTVNFFNRFLGLQGRTPFYKDEAKWLTVQTELSETGKTLFNVTYQKNKTQFTPEQLTASMLNQLKDIITKNGINFQGSNVVLSVPTYYTEVERKALLDACKIAEFPVERLYNETTAIATSYGLFRKADLDTEKPRYVAFVDLGHSKTAAFVGSFTKEKASIVAQVNDRNLGARDFDWTIYDHYCELFEQQSGGLTPRESKKAQLRLLEAIEKQRKVLSANSDAACNVDYLMEDVDFHHLLHREQFEKLVQPVLQRLQKLLEYLVEQTSNLKIQLHSVEIVGGATRIPIVQQIIQSVLKVDQVSKTLNASETVARGCAMMAAMKNPSFRVTEYNIEDVNFYPIRVGWLYGTTLDQVAKQQQGMEVEGNNNLNNLFPEKQRPILFDYNCTIPSLKSFNLSRAENIELTLYYDPVPPGFPAIIQQIRIPAVKPNHPEFHLKIRIRLNQNGLTGLEEVTLVEEFMEEVKVPKEKPAQAQQTQNQAPTNPPQEGQMQEEPPKEPQNTEQEFEIKKRKKTVSSNVNCEVSNYYSATQKEIEKFFEIEATLINQDKLTHETYRRKNELESYIYAMRDQLGSKLKDFSTAADKEQIHKELDTHYDWLYNDGAHTNKSHYTQRLDGLKGLCDPIVKRHYEFTSIPEATQDFLKNISQAEELSKSKDDKYAHITPEERQRVVQDSHAARQWVQSTLDQLNKLDKTKPFSVSTNDVTKQQTDFIQKTQSAMNRPKPAEPKKETTQPAQPQAQTENPEQQQQQGKMETE